MDILSKVSERLKELMFDKEINAPALAKAIGIKSNTVTRYLQGVSLPKFEIFVNLIDYFHCSADFLLGLADYPQYNAVFTSVLPFEESFRRALTAYNVSQYALQKQTGISWANFHFWLNGLRRPYLDSVVHLSQAIGCSVDYLLGRVN